MTDNQYYYAKHKLNGQCTKCRKPASEGKTMCAECLEKHRERQNKYYHEHQNEINERNKVLRAAALKKDKRSHKCVICHKARADKGYTTCWRCRADRNDRERVRYDNETDEHRQERLIKAKARAYSRKGRLLEQGLCISCGKRKADYGRQKCAYCAEKHNAARREKAHKAGVLPSDLRGKGDYCKMCCKPVSGGEKYCAECADKVQQTAKQLNDFNAQHEHNAGYLWFDALNRTELQEKRKSKCETKS